MRRSSGPRTSWHDLLVYVRIEFFRCGNVGLAARAIALALLGETTGVECRGTCWIEPNHFTVVRDRMVVVLFSLIRIAAVTEVPSICWIEPNGLIVVRDRMVVVLFMVIRIAAHAEDVRIFWIEPNGLIVVHDRMIVVLFMVIRIAAITEGPLIVW